MTGQPTDADILAAIKHHNPNGTMTYVIANVLRPKFKDVKTAYVRYRLKALERDGAVRRTQTSYMTQLCWALDQS
ncbi:hypothetical protein HDIA_0733 [Hartmannibacter diazotrophicus]|uniref:Ribonuclease R winged-helix domain-containing protein n=1 Tax=Hartmannibacter diazotrophicus TaxID=1482074 RepID=A0A2C9D212_9HYPH|nr:winged-helix domain-containing protein [Hartmannibacter diazotrophicus]SON54274.1 hypothetical protein HDIA_0733 [Hartmannibacter diazotrophicus]